MAAVATVHDRFSTGSVSDANIVGEKKKPSLVARILIGVAVFALLMLGYTSWRDSLIADGFAQGQQSARTELTRLRADLATAKAEIARKQGVLDAEIARKNTLAVANTRLTGERDRAVADLRIAMDKLKAQEAKKPAAPPARRQEQRRG